MTTYSVVWAQSLHVVFFFLKNHPREHRRNFYLFKPAVVVVVDYIYI